MQGVDLPELLITALFAAGCAHYFGARLAGKAREWEEKRHAIKTVEHFCDVLIRDSVEYWSGQVNHDNYGKMQAAAQKMGAMIFHLSAFTYRNFPKNNAASSAIGDILRTLTGGKFAEINRPPDFERVQMSATALVKLRFAVQENRKP